MLTAPRNLISIGRAARQLGTDVDRLTEVAGQIGVKAAETLDDVAFITREDREKIREHLHKQGGK